MESLFKAVAPPWADTIRICAKYCLIPLKYNENNNNMEYGGRYIWLRGVVLWWEVGGWGGNHLIGKRL